MDPIVIVVIIAVIAAVLFGAYWFIKSQNAKRTDELQGRFGPEYDRTVNEAGDRKRAEQELQQREERVSKLDIRPLSETQRQQYAESWRSVQARFVDDPDGAVAEADRLTNDVMTARGYPTGEYDQRSSDVSVDHPQVMANYRAAHDISQRAESGDAETEDLRQAMVHYRALFDDLLMQEPATARR